MTLLYPRFEKWGGYTGLPLSVVPSVVPSVLPYFRNTVSSKISPQPFKMETSYLVYRSTTTSCIVGLKMGLLLFVLPFVCSFFFLSKFFVKDISTYLSFFSLSKFFVKDISTYLFFLLFVPFSFFPNFSSKISPQPLKIETSNLVYRFITTSCIVGLV